MDTKDVGMAALIGAALPLLISVIVQMRWAASTQAVVAFVVCAIAAAATSYFSGAVHLADPGWDWVTWFGTIYGSAMVMYARFWKPTTVAPQIEARTNFGDTGGG